jgi:hypothetical protein
MYYILLALNEPLYLHPSKEIVYVHTYVLLPSLLQFSSHPVIIAKKSYESFKLAISINPSVDRSILL